MLRREFLGTAGMAIGATALSSASLPAAAKEDTLQPIGASDWSALRELFPLTRDYIHLSTFLLTSHPAQVSREIEKHRRAFDENPADYLHEHYRSIDMQIAQSAANYMGGDWTQIALTDSTTMGSAMVYSGLQVNPGDEMLQTTHDHYSTDMSLSHKAERSGAVVKRVALYDNPAEVSVAQCQQRLKQGITNKTRVVAVTWVQSYIRSAEQREILLQLDRARATLANDHASPTYQQINLCYANLFRMWADA